MATDQGTVDAVVRREVAIVGAVDHAAVGAVGHLAIAIGLWRQVAVVGDVGAACLDLAGVVGADVVVVADAVIRCVDDLVSDLIAAVNGAGDAVIDDGHIAGLAAVGDAAGLDAGAKQPVVTVAIFAAARVTKAQALDTGLIRWAVIVGRTRGVADAGVALAALVDGAVAVVLAGAVALAQAVCVAVLIARAVTVFLADIVALADPVDTGLGQGAVGVVTAGWVAGADPRVVTVLINGAIQGASAGIVLFADPIFAVGLIWAVGIFGAITHADADAVGTDLIAGAVGAGCAVPVGDARATLT